MADTISTKRITDLPEDTDVNDNDLFMAGSNGTASLRKKKWSTLLAKIKSVLLANNLTTTTAGYALDARQGKALKDQLDQQNTNISNLEASSDKVGVYTVITNGSEQHSAIFKLPFEQGRPSFLIVGNIGAVPFATLYTIANITNDLQDPISVNLSGTPTGLVVWVNANLGDRTQLRIVFTTPEGMGSNLSILAPGGRLIYSA